MTAHPDFISPIKIHLSQNNIVLRNASLTSIITALDRILHEIDSMTKVEYRREAISENKEIAQFMLEYGTIPKIKTLSAMQREYFYEFNYIMVEACEKALEWFPHNVEILDDDDLPGPEPPRNQWCMVEIDILFNQPVAPDTIILEFNRYTGDHWTPHWIYRYVKDRLLQELNWEARKHNLTLSEGCPDANCHISRYLFDENIQRELCTYLSPQIVSI